MPNRKSSQTGFASLRTLFALLLFFGGVMLASLAFRNASAQGGSPPEAPGTAIYRGLSAVVHFDVSPPLRDITPIPPGPGQLRENEDQDIVPRNSYFGLEPDPVVQSKTGNGLEIPQPIISFDGPSNSSGVSPPDSNGEVGPNHVVVMCNLSFQIYNKSGTSVFGPAANNTLWSGFGGPCQTQNAGDPVVLYDQLATRWLLSQFTSGSAPFYNCVAISQTPDPTGAYFRYAIITGPTGANFPDYPKYGVWPDAYYLSTREFLGSAGPFQGVGAYALNRAQMLAGNPSPQVISFLVPPSGSGSNVGDGLLPADVDGTTPPPVGSPEYFMGSMDNNGQYGAPQDALNLYKFHVDFVTPANSTFTLTNVLSAASFNSILGLCGGGRACIPQPSTTTRIDHLGYRQRPLHRLAYRNFGTHESLVTNQSVSAGTGPSGEVSGIRWWEVRNPNVAPVVFQEGTYAPGLTDGIHRWMGSIAMDAAGNMGLAYSVGNGTVFPGVRYTGRLVSDPLGQMPQGESAIIAGTGSQTGSNRWGDYSALSVDPTDDQTFWFVSEYVPTTSSVGWRLRIGSFRVAPAATPTPTPSPSPTPSPTPIVTISGTDSYCSNPPGPVANVGMTLTGSSSGSTTTNASGNYTFSVTTGGTYTITPSKAALPPGSASIDTVDVVAVQRHFLNLGTALTGCRLTAADVNGVNGVDTVDVIAVQRFFLGLTTGVANCGQYKFNPVNRNYSGIGSNQTGQNYDALNFGDVASPFVH